MTTVYHELLPESYLLRLAPGPANEPELALEHSLRCAGRSGKPAVWVDCELLPDLPGEAVRVLRHYQHRLANRHVQLVLVHVSDAVKQHLLNQDADPGLCCVPSLPDAAGPGGGRLVA